MTRIHILGASGSGTTTLGRAVAAALDCPFFDTDDYYWQPTDPPFTTPRDVQDRLELLRHDLERPGGWVLSGSLAGWGDPLIPLFDLVVFLTVPTEVRLARLGARERERYGEARLAPGGDQHAGSSAFIAWAAAYDDGDGTRRSRIRHEDWLRTLPCPVLRLDGEGDLGDLVRAVAEAAGLTAAIVESPLHAWRRPCRVHVCYTHRRHH